MCVDFSTFALLVFFLYVNTGFCPSHPLWNFYGYPLIICPQIELQIVAKILFIMLGKFFFVNRFGINKQEKGRECDVLYQAMINKITPKRW